MKFTFGIITAPDSKGCLPHSLNIIFESIVADEPQDDIEVIVVGGNENKTWEHYRFIAFDETIKPKWITKKKNIITAEAKYDNIVYMHDYVTLMPGWFRGMEKFGNNWDILMTPIINADGTRYRDWSLWPHDITPDGSADLNALLPYNETRLSKYMYFSGAYWIAKCHVMQEFPLDESLSWGEGEDVKLSKQVRQKYIFSMNSNSYVKLLKYKERIFNEATQATITRLLNNL